MKTEIYSEQSRFTIDLVLSSTETIRTYSFMNRYEIKDGDKVIIGKQGQSLKSIAIREYDNEDYWFILADINDMVNPFDDLTGLELTIPTKLNLEPYLQ